MNSLNRRVLDGLASGARKIAALNVAMRYNPIARAPVLRAIEGIRGADLTARRALNEQLLAGLSREARRTRYGRVLDGDYADWPILTKAHLRDAPGDFTLKSSLSLPVSTGGSTGVPLRLRRSFSNVAAEQVFLDDMIGTAVPGLTWSRARVAILRADTFKYPEDLNPPFWRYSHRNRRLHFSVPHLNLETVGVFHAELAAFRPDILWVTPTKAANLLALMEQAGLRLKLPLILSSSERMYTPNFLAVEAAFGARVIDYYGQTERLCFAMATAPETFYFNPAYGKVELRPTGDPPGPDGWSLARIIASGFWNAAMPIIRYDTGDFALVPANASPDELEAITLGVSPFGGISGRDDDYVYTPDGLKMGDLDLVSREMGNVLQVQIVQESLTSIVIRVIARPEFDAKDEAKLLAVATSRLPPCMDVRVAVVDELELTAGGKARFVIRRLLGPMGNTASRAVPELAC